MGIDMKILAHRGYWNKFAPKNTILAIKMALERGYGFESDVRDFEGNVVISHDIADSNCQKAEEIFKLLHDYSNNYTFAINIKADGLKNLLSNLLYVYDIHNYFLFDMSIPQMVEFKEKGLRFFTRQSEVESFPCMYEDAAGIWIDGFWSTDWITKDIILNHLEHNKDVCLVSPDLHSNQNFRDFWKKLKGYNMDTDRIMLCTDYPDEARNFFNE